MRANDQSVLILGTAQLATDYGVTRGSQPVKSRIEATEFLQFAQAEGIEDVDTAPAYGDAEFIIGETPISFRLHTKVEKGFRCVDSLLRSQARLKSKHIDVLYVHDVDEFRRRPREIDSELEVCLDHGVARVGVSLYSPDEIELILQCRNVNVVQIPLNVLDQRFVPHIPRLVDAGVSCIARSVFLQGTLLQNFHELPQRVQHLSSPIQQFQNICQRDGISFLAGALGWVRSIRDVQGVIIGAQNTVELKSIIDAWNGEGLPTSLNPDQIELPDEVSVDPRKWKTT